jgi:hypothetical protein
LVSARIAEVMIVAVIGRNARLPNASAYAVTIHRRLSLLNRSAFCAEGMTYAETIEGPLGPTTGSPLGERLCWQRLARSLGRRDPWARRATHGRG